MSMFEISEDKLAKLMYPGLLAMIRSNLKGKIMETLEKEVDGALDNALENLKGAITSYRNFQNDEIVFNIQINGVPIKKGGVD